MIQQYKELAKFCYTDAQERVFDFLIEGKTQAEVATELGISTRSVERTVARVRRKASLQGYSPENDMVHTAPDSHFVKGVSTLYDEEGKVSRQWVKTDARKEALLEVFQEAVGALVEDLPVKGASVPESVNYSNTLSVYPLGDPHIGMYAWGEEAGEDFDLEIATTNLVEGMRRLVRTAPPSDKALIVQLGDFFHSDTQMNITLRSGNRLDVDGRWAKVLRAGVLAMRTVIEESLEYHNHVTVINCPGNHDDHSAMFLALCLEHIFENEPRIDIRTEPTVTHYYRYGKVLLGAHHGHTIKSADLPLVMANERKEDWGDTEYRTFLTGHIHHDTVKEYSGCTVESFRTLAAKDAWTTSHGYNSLRDSKCIVYCPEYGEIERHTVSIRQLAS